MLVEFTVAQVDRSGNPLNTHTFTAEVSNIKYDVVYPEDLDIDWFWDTVGSKANPWGHTNLDIDVIDYQILKPA